MTISQTMKIVMSNSYVEKINLQMNLDSSKNSSNLISHGMGHDDLEPFNIYLILLSVRHQPLQPLLPSLCGDKYLPSLTIH